MRSEKEHQNKGGLSKQNWRVHAVIVIWCLLAVSTEHWFPGWSGAIAVGGAVPALLIYSTPKAWGEVWYWVTITIFALLQLPLMLYVQPLIVTLKISFLFVLAFADYFVVVAAMQCLALIFSRAYARTRT
jgi:hypothetical protein